MSPAALTKAAARAIRPELISTLHALPGYRIVRSLGVVTELSATSGFTATMKGNAALTSGMADFLVSAERLGANAVLGLTVTTFGAEGGITSAFGGDAVGVLLMGTAVVVEREPSIADPPQDQG